MICPTTTGSVALAEISVDVPLTVELGAGAAMETTGAVVSGVSNVVALVLDDWLETLCAASNAVTV